jgi:YegS/Rv2252/BmrU family lipid kinase
VSDSNANQQKRILIIENPHSGGGDGDISTAVLALTERGFNIEHKTPESPEEARRFVENETDADFIAVAGGDGTLSTLLPSLIEKEIPLIVLPRGTANDFARGLNLPVDPETAISAVEDGEIRAVDVGYANGHPFLNAASIGMSAEVTERQTKERKRQFGAVSYAISAWEARRDIRPFKVRLEGKGESRTVQDCIQLLVGNGPHYGGGMTVREGASLQDGHLNISIVRAKSPWTMATALPFLKTGRADFAPHVDVKAVERIRIEPDRKMTVYADGEPITKTPTDFEVKPATLSVLVPKEDQNLGDLFGVRSTEELAMNDLFAACLSAQKFYETACTIPSESSVRKHIDARAKHYAHLKRRLRLAISDEWKAPNEPDVELEWLKSLALSVQSVLSRDETALLLDKCCTKEGHVLQAISNGGAKQLPDDLIEIAEYAGISSLEGLISAWRLR